MVNKLISCFVVWAILLVAVECQSCSNTCTDYHRLCPGTTDQSKFDNYRKAIKNGLIKFPKDVPENKPDCNDEKYKFLCPMSCGECTPCYVSTIQDVQSKMNAFDARVKSLEDTVKALTDKVTKLESTVSPQVVDIPINSATSSEEYNSQYVLANSHDGGLKTYIDYCFHSKANSNGWAEYEVPMSKVTKVGVLNRESVGSARRLKGSRVEVCEVPGGCNTICGVFPDVPASEWGFVDCPAGGIQGSYVRIVNDNDFLQICEMDIKGYILKDPPLRTTSIISATSSEPFYAKWNLANSHDGGLKTYIDYCFHSKTQTNGWAEYKINTAAVRYVGVLNRESVTSAMRLKGARVEVCTQSGGCSNTCGTFEDVAASTWSYVKCPGRGIVGSYVRVVNPGDFLQICEMDIRVV